MKIVWQRIPGRRARSAQNCADDSVERSTSADWQTTDVCVCVHRGVTAQRITLGGEGNALCLLLPSLLIYSLIQSLISLDCLVFEGWRYQLMNTSYASSPSYLFSDVFSCRWSSAIHCLMSSVHRLLGYPHAILSGQYVISVHCD